MKWEPDQCDDGEGDPWIKSDTPVGEFVIDQTWDGSRFVAHWWPAFVSGDEVLIGQYVSQSGAKKAVKRYAKRMAKAFQALAKAGWE